MIRVENKRRYQGCGVYVGRPSLLGNPYVIGKDGDKGEVIRKYRVWLWQQIQQRTLVYRELQRLAEIARKGDVHLICWCKQPDHEVACHGDILKLAINWINSAME